VDSQPNHKSSARSELKKKQILQEALMCFSEHGVAGTTIETICDATQTSVGSLYHHFGNKDAIMRAVYFEGLRDFGRLMKRYLNDVGTEHTATAQHAQKGVKALVFANVDWISQQSQWAQYVFHNRPSRKGLNTKLSDEKRIGVNKGDTQEGGKVDGGGFSVYIFNWFAPYIAAGLIQDFPKELLNAFITGPVHNYARHWLAGRRDVPLIEYRDAFAEAAWLSIKK
jgi:AcrR family transcriptional regulator